MPLERLGARIPPHPQRALYRSVGEGRAGESSSRYRASVRGSPAGPLALPLLRGKRRASDHHEAAA